MNNHIYPGRDKCIIYLQVLLIHPLSMINSGKDFLFYFQLRNNRVENDSRKRNKTLKILSLIVSQQYSNTIQIKRYFSSLIAMRAQKRLLLVREAPPP